MIGVKTMFETILIAFIVAKLKGYNIKPIFKSWEIYPIIIFELFYVFMQISIFLGNYDFIVYSSIYKKLYLYSFIFLIIKHKQYISAIIGSVCIFIGTILNNIAITTNNGKMPVFPTLSYYTGYATKEAFDKIKDIHVLGNEATKLKFLTDIFDVGYSIISIGDILIRLFAFIIIYSSVKYVNKIQRT